VHLVGIPLRFTQAGDFNVKKEESMLRKLIRVSMIFLAILTILACDKLWDMGSGHGNYLI